MSARDWLIAAGAVVIGLVASWWYVAWVAEVAEERERTGRSGGDDPE